MTRQASQFGESHTLDLIPNTALGAPSGLDMIYGMTSRINTTLKRTDAFGMQPERADAHLCCQGGQLRGITHTKSATCVLDASRLLPVSDSVESHDMIRQTDSGMKKHGKTRHCNKTLYIVQ